MGGKSKSTKVGNHYRIAYHAGLAGRPIDAFLEFRAADKTAWAGRLTASGRLQINAPDLFGGEKDQGGIVGPIDVMFGEPDQLPNPFLQSVFGHQTVAWRGMTTLAFAGGRYGAMNPFAQKPAYKVEKILRGWDGDEPWFPETAIINSGEIRSAAIYFALDVSGSMQEQTPNGQTRLTNAKAAIIAALDYIKSAGVELGVRVDLCVVAWGSYPEARSSATRRNCSPADVDYLKSWVNSLSSIYGTYFPAGVMDMAEFFSGSPSGIRRTAFFITDGEPVDASSGKTPLQIAQEAASIVSSIPGGAVVHGINIDLADTSYTRIVDNTPSKMVPVVEGGNPSALTGIITNVLGARISMNPAHILYYCRTDSEKGREPRANINQDSLAGAAVKLWGEGFGLCTVYNPEQDSPASFEERICRIIGGSFERSLVDGQWYLDLARGEYDPAALPVMDDDDILEFKELPTTLERATNSIAVRYFDPHRKETIITPAVRALGLIRQFGEIHETLDFPEIPNGILATRRADMELRSRTTPTRAFDLVTTPRLAHLRRNQYFMLRSAKRGITGLVCIVGEKDIGTLRSGAVRWKVAQDTYSLPDTSYAEIEPGVDTRPPQNPLAIELARAYEAPYIDVASMLPHAELQALPQESGYLLGVAAQPDHGLDYTMSVAPEGGEYQPAATADWCPTATLSADLPWGEDPVTVGLRAMRGLHRAALGSPVLVGPEIMRLDALDVAEGTATLARGCADTIPHAHQQGDRLWFIGNELAIDPTEYTEGETVGVKMLTNTGSQQLDPGAAATLPVTFAARQARPYPPAKLRIDGYLGPDYPGTALDGGEITWVHRDRVAQADQLIDASMGNIGPEPNVAYRIDIHAEARNGAVDPVPFAVADIVDPPSWVYDEMEHPAPPGTAALVYRVWAERDGLESWQAPELRVPMLLPPTNVWAEAPELLPPTDVQAEPYEEVP